MAQKNKNNKPSKQAPGGIPNLEELVPVQAIGVEGAQYVDPETGQPKEYKGYQAIIPNRVEDYPAGTPFEFLSSFRVATPRYFEGSQYLPASTLSVDEIIDLQKRMEAAGYYSDNADITWGVWNPADVNVYANVLATTNRAGTDADTIIQQATAARMFGPQQAKKRQPLVVKLTNPSDIKTVANSVAQELYGGDLPDDDAIDAITAGFQAAERHAYQQAYDVGETGGELVSPPSLDTYAAEQIKERYPDQVAVTQFGNHMDSILSTFTRSRV